MTARVTADKVRIAQWLERRGLAQYAQAFEEHNIGFDVLPELGDEDLKELGVPLGDRRRLLKAIAGLRMSPESADDAMTSAAARGPPIRRVDPERRQLTLLFCDLVGSTELSARLDPEDLGEVVHAYQACVATVVERFEGHVAKYLGDGVLVHFGYPRAHEDDAERAVRSGLAIAEAVAALVPLPDVQLQARVGIATGTAVVGDLIGEGASREAAVVGDVPNLAARLQALAMPSSVVISQATRRLVGGLFELAELGPVRLKGFAEPLAAWRVEGEGPAESRFEARQTAGLTPLVGREEEIALLLRRWRQARDGEGQVVLLAGEPGIGKSRLVRELRGRLSEEPHIRLLCQCSPHHTASPLHPLIEQLERAAGFARNDPPAMRLDKLEALLARGTERLDEVVPLIAALLALPTGDRYPALTLTPDVQKWRTLQALVDQVAGLAAEQPVLALFEDVHWIDPSTLELLSLVMERIRRLPVLVLVTFRPEFQPPWTGHAHVTALSISRLGRRQGADLAARVTGDKPLPGEIVEQIVARTDGVPLFVEELTKTVLESGLLADAGDHFELSGPLPPLAIPATLHDSLMARLDRLAPIKEVAQVGAVIGREFSHELLAAVAPMSANRLIDALEQLVNSELVFRRGEPPEASYTFKHALVQEAAYQSLLKSKRQQLHTEIGHVLEERFPDVVATKPEILAHHWREARKIDKAAHYLRATATRAVERSSHREAVAHLAAALELVEAQPFSVGRRQTETDLWLSLGAALIAPKGYAANEVREAFAHARERSHETGDRKQLFLALRGLWNCHLLRTELREANALAEQVFELAQQFGTAERMLVAHRVMATSLFHLGRIEDARRLFTAGLAFWDPGLSADYTVAYGEDPGLFCCVYAAWCDDFVGFRDEALVKMRRSLDHARGQPNRYGLAVALSYAAVLHQFRREPECVANLAQEGIELCREQGIVQWLAHHQICRGWALAVEGHHSDGLRELREGIAAWQGIKMQLMMPYFSMLLAQTHAAAGQIDSALQALAETDGPVARTGHETFEAIRANQRGELLLGASAAKRAQAERQFVRCLELARSQRARSWELRAATSLARLWAHQGKRTQARDLLAPVYGWFTEGFDTADLKDAKALLDELG